MTTIITRYYETAEAAAAAVNELQEEGFARTMRTISTAALQRATS